jgi:serine/threonine protein kinase
LIEGLLAYDPSKRLTIAQIKAHAWFTASSSSTEEVAVELAKRRELLGLPPSVEEMEDVVAMAEADP